MTHDRAQKALAEEVAALTKLLAPFDAFDLVAHLWFANIAFNPETYRETEHHGLQVVVELCAALLAARPSRRGTAPRTLHIPPEVLEEANQRLRAAASHLSILRLARTDRGGPLGSYMTELVNQEHWERAPCYEWQERDMLCRLLGGPPMDATLLETVGLTIEQALELADAINDLPMARLSAVFSALNTDLEPLRYHLATAQPPADSRLAQLYYDLIKQPWGEQEEAFVAISMAAATATAGEHFSFTAAEAAAMAAVDERATAAFLALFSQPFGATSDIERTLSQFRTQPLLLDPPSNRFCCGDVPPVVEIEQRQA